MDKFLRQPMSCGGMLFASIWVLGWTAGTLAFDVMFSYQAGRQIAALGYPTVAGTVTKSEVRIESDGEGSTNKPYIEYDYAVDGKRFHSEQYRYLTISALRSTAKVVVDRYPVGQQVAVRYNPRDPADSLLEPGLQSGDTFILMFMTPFNLVMFGCLLGVVEMLRASSPEALPWGVSQRQSFEGVTLRIYSVTPMAAAAAVLFVASFGGIFAALFVMWLAPKAPVMLGIWGIVLGIAAWAWQRQRKRCRLLSINELRQRYELSDAARGRSVAGALADIDELRITCRTKRDSEGTEHKNYAVSIVCRIEGKRKLRTLVRDWTIDSAERLARWLQRKLGVKEITVLPRSPAEA